MSQLLDVCEARLRQELKSLTQLKTAIQDSLASTVKERMLDVIRSLKIKLVTLLSTCSKLRDDYDSGADVSEQVTALNEEYKQAVRSLEKLTEATTGNLKEPPRLPPPAPTVSINKDPVTLLSKEIEGLKRLIQRTQTHIEDHTHPGYEDQIRELVQDSDQLMIETASFVDQHQRVHAILSDLAARVSEAEGNRTYTAPIQLSSRRLNT